MISAPRKRIEETIDHIRNTRPSLKHECKELKLLNPEDCDNKKWRKLKVFIQNEYKKRENVNSIRS